MKSLTPFRYVALLSASAMHSAAILRLGADGGAESRDHLSKDFTSVVRNGTHKS